LQVTKPEQEVSGMSLLELFVDVDDYCKVHAANWQQVAIESGGKRRHRAGRLYMSEVMTLLIHFHQSQYRHFKAYYSDYVQVHLRGEFPGLVSYNRFVELMPSVLVPLCGYLSSCYGQCTGISFIDATSLAVCDNHRIHSHRVFDGLAKRGKTSMGWFYGFKLHVVVNDCGQLLGCCLSAANVHDTKPVPQLAAHLFGKLFGDKGYISKQLFEMLFNATGLQLITKLRKNMRNALLSLDDKLLLRKRAIIESINDQLKNISQIQHTRHRSPLNFLVNVVAGLIAYCLQPKKPSLGISRQALVLA
jgi:DDE family transposase